MPFSLTERHYPLVGAFFLYIGIRALATDTALPDDAVLATPLPSINWSFLRMSAQPARSKHAPLTPKH